MQAGIPDFDELAFPGPSSQLNGGSLQWFALVVKPRFDKAVARALEMKGYETLLPLYKKHHKYGARSKSSELPLFPGYVCCRFDVHSRLPILTTPGVIHVLGAGNMPIPVSDGEINSLKTAIGAGLPIQPFAFVNDGAKVRISSGALAGIEGIVLKTKPSLRLILSVTLLQRSVVLEIDHDQVGACGVPDAGGWPV
ncbi:MAG: transcription termination/antitermination NusG family protein [Bryobacteraceae bacterium]|jgi:transcription antitermination factor NusG